MTIENARFRKPVVPGDQMLIKVKKERQRGHVWRFRGEAYVDDILCAEAVYTAMLIPNGGKSASGAAEIMTKKIHPTAIVDAAAQIGADVEIGPYCVIGPHVKLADGVHLQSHVAVDGHTSIGPNHGRLSLRLHRP